MTHEEILQLLYDETLVGNAPAPICSWCGAHENGKFRLRSTGLSPRKNGDGMCLPSKCSISPSG